MEYWLHKRYYSHIRRQRNTILTLTEGTIPSESSVTGTVESSNHIRTGGIFMTIMRLLIALIHICNEKH